MDHGALTLAPAAPAQAHAPAQRVGAARARGYGGRVATVLLAGAAALAVAVAVAAAFGVRAELKLTGSMRPAIAPNDLLVVHRVAAAEMRVGDIVSFASPAGNGMVITHRVRALHRAPGGRIAVVTRGDANNTSERWTIAARGTVARVIAVLPQVGRLTNWAGNPTARLAVFLTLGLLMLAAGLRRVWRRP